MMGLRLTILFFIFSIVNLGIHGESPRMYWNNVLPNTHMPKAITDSLTGATVTAHWKYKPVYNKHTSNDNRNYWAASETELSADPKMVISWVNWKDMKPGTKMILRFPRSDDVPAFLPRHVAASIPFSSAQFSTILRHFSLSPDSEEATAIKQTIQECEQTHVVLGEEKYCPTSLESMVDFAVTRLGKKNVRAISTDAALDDGKKKVFTVTAVKKVTSTNGGSLVACHKENYPYAVFFCHKTTKSAAYTVELVAEGQVVKAAAVCHEDTSGWNPKLLAFKLLKVKPGSAPVCHILPKEDVVWVQN